MNHSKEVSTSASLKWHGWTDRGKVRANNEDSFLGLQFDSREVYHLGRIGEASIKNMDFAFAVSDGMGGAHAGEFASRIAVEKITKLLPRSFQQSARGLEAGVDDVLAELFDQIHRALAYVGSSYEECHGMEATLSLCWFTPGWMYFGHIGDSRIYHLASGGALTQLTHDHGHVGWLRRNQRITEREARSHPMRNVLHQSLGAGHQFIEPQYGAMPFTPGDRFLLCSDGLIEGMWDRHLDEMVREPELAPLAQHLIAAALERSGRDNITALVVEAIAPPARQP